MEETLKLFPPVVLKECHFLERERHLVGSCGLDTKNHANLALSNLEQDNKTKQNRNKNRTNDQFLGPKKHLA